MYNTQSKKIQCTLYTMYIGTPYNVQSKKKTVVHTVHTTQVQYTMYKVHGYQIHGYNVHGTKHNKIRLNKLIS